METLSRITICSQTRETHLGEGELKISRDYTCIYVSESNESVLPDWDVHGHSIIASDAGDVQYTGDVVDVLVHDSAPGSKVTLLCQPPEPPDR